MHIRATLFVAQNKCESVRLEKKTKKKRDMHLRATEDDVMKLCKHASNT